MRTIYSIGIFIASRALKLLSFFNSKLKLGEDGRKNTFKTLKENISKEDRTLWFHCASLGEYEQGLPVFEALRKKYAEHKIIISFFSPSGYEVRKKSPIADAVVYMPLDTKQNAKHFLDLVHPDFIIFVKYEIWPNFLDELKHRKLRAILISAVFRKNQHFFKWYGKFMSNSLRAFEHVFVQDTASKTQLEAINYTSVTVSGDTRFDRVSNQLETDNTIDFIEPFKGSNRLIVFGSSWPEDDTLFLPFINASKHRDLKFLIAPHNINPDYIKRIKAQVYSETVAYSNAPNDDELKSAKVLILDTIGYLSKAYSYADIAYVGGAAGSTGLHNVLEPAVFGVPILIGRNFDKFPEAKKMIELGGVISVKMPKDFSENLSFLIKHNEKAREMGQRNAAYIQENKGAVIQILDYIRI